MARKNRNAMPDWFVQQDRSPPACVLCRHEYDRAKLTKHHLVPKSRGGTETVLLCRPCHKTVHATFTEKELERDYDTVEALRNAEALHGWISWIRKRKPGKRIRVR
ncbi:hypothetical protein CA12_23390 [Alienimonas californiensis]|uniref:HNH endonuclease 5 domain-containing protein n=2 Tax=Alienimonas californiensis TaxID=2527989 RepID=A0A517PA39_9PLAN|nr:hypothetical protein CA12_23390 [Alienimonas californiensis]